MLKGVLNMKKLFSLVLVLAMALAIAVPALASTGWDKPEPTPTNYDDFAMTAAKYEWYSATTGGYGANGVYFPNWNDSNGIVRDTLGRVYFTATLPKASDAAALYPGVDFSNLTVKITLTNVKGVQQVDLSATPIDYAPVLSTAGISSKNVYTATATGTLGASTQTLKYMYVFRAADAADVVASITITAGAVALPTTFLYKGVQVNAGADSSGYGDWAFSTSNGDKASFDTDSSDKIQRMFIVSGTTVYQVFIDINNNIAFKDGNASIQYGNTGYSTLKSIYDFFMGALGFQWDGTVKYMNAALIVKNLVKTASGSATVTFPGGYQSIITPPIDPTVQPPQTGDTTTVVGFAMIALALVAAGIVTVRKIRA
jgi:LPXTG-motif cell wall-anchored protein